MIRLISITTDHQYDISPMQVNSNSIKLPSNKDTPKKRKLQQEAEDELQSKKSVSI
jgi:hypothetical protein